MSGPAEIDAPDPMASLPAEGAAAPLTIQLGLLSHTNAGKTTLARTLLRRDIGEVSDRAHVTEVAERHVLVESPDGDALALWDTPGFGDSVRLLKRLRQSSNPIGWLMSQVWDRFVDRPFWSSQQAMRNARDESDVILYIVNAGESPEAAAYVDVEMQILSWIGKPIVLLLNQLGPPRDERHGQADVDRWQTHVASHPLVRSVVPFDAFVRCWIQEAVLLGHIQEALSSDKHAAFGRLRDAWRRRNLEIFDRSMQLLARQLASIAIDEENVTQPALQQKARAWLTSVVTGSEQRDTSAEFAQKSLAERLDLRVRETTEELVRLHGLTGRATAEVLQRLGREFAVERPADADKAGVFGGLVSGALGGLAADLAAGGLTFGAGILIGGVLGAFGARGLTQAYNVVRGTEKGIVRWSPEFLTDRAAAALIRYLAVAHFGRGRGEFTAGAAPEHWRSAVAAAIEHEREALERAWRLARPEPQLTLDSAEPPREVAQETIEAELLPALQAAAVQVLQRLYPESSEVLNSRSPTARIT